MAWFFEFLGSDLGGCEDFYVPNHDIYELRVTHSGTDGWVCEYFTVVFDDNTFATCPDGYEIDKQQVHNLGCNYPGKDLKPLLSEDEH